MNIIKNMADTSVYSNDELLDRAYSKIVVNKGKIKVIPPIVIRQNMKSYLTNFDKIVSKLGANKDDMLKFFSQELEKGTSINQEGQMVIESIYDTGKISSIIKSFIKERMMCRQCKSINTKVIVANRISKMHCFDCNSFCGIDNKKKFV
jgi:translation initiation factor 2 beta subunit (eIF-2beta)/eIF-5